MGFPEVGCTYSSIPNVFGQPGNTVHLGRGSIANFNDVVRIRMDLDYQGPTIDRKLEI